MVPIYHDSYFFQFGLTGGIAEVLVDIFHGGLPLVVMEWVIGVIRQLMLGFNGADADIIVIQIKQFFDFSLSQIDGHRRLLGGFAELERQGKNLDDSQDTN